MLSLQAAEFPGERAVQDLVARTEARIEAIALVHELLFSHQDLSRIPAQAYVTNLTDFLVREGAAPGRITVNLEADDLPIILDTAVPFGLILNELVTNSLRWAFPGDRTGTITITLTRSGPGRVRFTYADDGVGVPEGFDFHRTPSLGLTLVRNLGSDQMLGTVRFENRGGVHFSLDFPDNLYRPRV
jgi:two-component sensor histidine kinase